MLDEMQAQWLARVVEGCAHARVGLTLRGAFSGRLSEDLLVGILGYAFGGTEAHLLSCVSTRKHRDGPRLALVSHALALAATPMAECQEGYSAILPGRKQLLQMVKAQLVDVAEAAGDGGCEWLHAYWHFIQQRRGLLGSCLGGMWLSLCTPVYV
jgi:hypothetical protein